MPTYDEAMQALRAADAAGNKEDAARLAKIADGLKPKAAAKAEAPKPEKKQAPDLVEGMMPLLGPAEAALGVGSRMISPVLGNIAGLGSIPLNMMGLEKRGSEDVRKSVTERFQYDPRTATGQAGVSAFQSPLNPLNMIGQGVDWMGRKAEEITAPPGSGPIKQGLGRGVGEAVRQLPMLLGSKAPAAAEAGSAAMKGGAQRFMQSALKPGEKFQRTGKSAKGIDTLLEEGINVTPGGMEKLQQRVSVLNDKISRIIENSPAIIDKTAAQQHMGELVKKWKNQVDNLDDVAAIQKSWDNFVNDVGIPDKIPIQQAQSLKTGTYARLGEKAYGETQTAGKEAQKTLARGLKDEIAKMAPEVRTLNAEESKLLNALSMVEKRVMMSANKNPGGLGWLTANPKKFALWMADRSELFKSLIARMLNTGSRATPGMEVAGPVGGLAATQQADQRNQIAPPPQ